jgi:hypothetical protein
LLPLVGGLEMLAGLLALISLVTVVALLFGVPVDPIAAVLTRPFGHAVLCVLFVHGLSGLEKDRCARQG